MFRLCLVFLSRALQQQTASSMPLCVHGQGFLASGYLETELLE